MTRRSITRCLAGSALASSLSLASAGARAQTGVCDSNPPVSTQACIDAIQSNGSVINDIFKDANGLTGQQLPVFGTLFANWPGCDTTPFAGCAGQSQPPYDCPGQYTCAALAPTIANASAYLNALDRLWWHPCRLANHQMLGACPDWTCIANGVGGAYNPWEGLVFDLGGPSNKVAIFAQNDHGPQPCESTEYTVYLSDNPYSQEAILDPKTTGVDPMKWNRAVLTTLFTKGWVEVRPPDPVGYAACGDTADYSVEEDSFAQVFALPCGITFRYAAIIAGNDGLDFPQCAYDSDEAELDAVAGLTESGAAVCPDADGDLYVDCNCPGAPLVCDCDDANPGIHPGAPEACDSPDLSCDGVPGSCTGSLVCYQSLCIAPCEGENQFCPAGSTCTQTPEGTLCVPADCTVGGCPPGGVCSNGVCVPVCTGVVCPGAQTCVDGQCIDPCAGIQCPAGQLCQAGACHSPCSCFAGQIGCADQAGTVCDAGNTGLCVAPACAGVVCNAGETCDAATGMCKPFCDPSVVCPPGQKCSDPAGCVPLCEGVTCEAGFTCDPATGQCVDMACKDVNCFPPQVCVMGQCIDPGTGSGGAGGAGGSGGGAGTSSSSGNGAGGAPSGSGNDPGDEGGCGCRTAGRSGGVGWAGLLVLAAGAAIGARRRATRARRSPPV